MRTDGWDFSEGVLVPRTEPPADLPSVQHGLVADLRSVGLNETANYYQQAVDAWGAQHLEASNAQLRTCLESVVLEIGARHSIERARFTTVLKRLVELGALDDKMRVYLEGLWGISQQQGSHPGQATKDEAFFRLHVVTATLRRLLPLFD